MKKALWLSILAFVIAVNSSFAQWLHATNGIYGGEVRSLIAVGSRLLAATGAGVFVSDDEGENWSASNAGLDDKQAYVLAEHGGKIFVGNNAGVFVSGDNGDSWSNSGNLGRAVFSIAFRDTRVFATTQEGVAISPDEGGHWNISSQGLPDTGVINVATFKNKVFVTSFSGLFVSDNDGNSWSPTEFTSIGFPLIANETKIVTVLNDDLYVSENGTDWDLISTTFGGVTIGEIAFKGSDIVIGASKGVFFYIGEDYTQVASSLSDMNNNPTALLLHDDKIFFGYDGDLLVSEDDGDSWEMINKGRTAVDVRAFTASGNKVLAGTFGNGVFATTDNGATWTESDEGLHSRYIRSMGTFGTTILAGVNDWGIFKSIDGGTNWEWTSYHSGSVYAFAGMGDKIFAAYGSGVLVSENDGDNWSPANNGLTFANSNDIIAEGEKLYLATNDGVFVSSNEGDSWSVAGTDLPNKTVHELLIINEKLFIATENGAYSLSADDAAWELVEVDFPTLWISVGGNEDYSFIAPYYGIDPYISRNGGATWHQTALGASPSSSNVHAIEIFNDHVFVGTVFDGAFVRDLSDFDDGLEITSFTPDAGGEETVVTITGSGFEIVPKGNVVRFNGPSAEVLTATPTTLTVKVPVGATTGKITVTKFGLVATSATDFTILIVGLEDESGVDVYPTIAKDFIYVKTSNTSQSPMIYDGLGRVMKTEQSVFDKTICVNISGLSNGLYFMRLPETGRRAFRFWKK